MVTVFTVAILSGLLQALGYLVYIRKCLRHEVRPNPTTWVMFAYGTATLTVLELATVGWDLAGNFLIFILPITCALMSLRVAAICWSQGSVKWPKKPLERTAILIDISLTIAYAYVWEASRNGDISEEMREALTVVFLVLTNVSTAVSFIPILQGTREDPRGEHPLPWSIWCTAYCLLGYVTFSEHGIASVLIIYPISNAILHGLVGLLSMRRYRKGTAT